MAGCLLGNNTNRIISSSSPTDLNRPQSSLKRKRNADNSATLLLVANKQTQSSKLDSKCKLF